MMTRSRRGAARVSITWMIVVVIAFFGALAMVFVYDGELTKAEQAAQEAEREAAAELAAADELRVQYRDLSEVVGYYDTEAAAAETDLTQATEGLTQFKDGFNVTDESVATLQAMIGRAFEERQKLTQEVRDLKAQVSTLQGDIDVRAANLAAMTAEKDAKIRELNQQVNDANQAAADRQNELESEIASVRASLADTESQLRSARGETDSVSRAKREREAEFTTRLQNVTKKLEWTREPERADGEILDVSEALGLAYIDLGKNNRLYGGMRFAIVSGHPGDDTIKAYCEVLNVNAEMSEVKVYDIRDRFDPPTKGDVIYNPLYDPTGLRNAVLVGRFSGSYNEKELRALLEGININLQGKLDKTTDYLIVGAELYVDEDGEPLEEPMQPSDLPVYKEAEAMGVRIVPLKLVTDYFRKTTN
jgi:hypothetical protein